MFFLKEQEKAEEGENPLSESFQHKPVWISHRDHHIKSRWNPPEPLSAPLSRWFMLLWFQFAPPVVSDSSILSAATATRKDLIRRKTSLAASSVTLPGRHPRRNDNSRQSTRLKDRAVKRWSASRLPSGLMDGTLFFFFFTFFFSFPDAKLSHGERPPTSLKTSRRERQKDRKKKN